MSMDSAELLQLPPSVLAVLPAGIPPPGVTPDFEHPQTVQPLIIGMTSTSIAICTIFFSLRCYNKIFVTRKLWWDDLTCLLAYLCTLALYTGIMACTYDGPMGKHMYEIHVSDLFGNAWLIGAAFIMAIFIVPTLLFVKATFFLMYYAIFKPFWWMRWFCIIGGTLSTAFYGAASIVQFYFASPSNGESFAEHDFRREIYKLFILNIPIAAVGLGIDVLLFVMPLIAVSRLNMPLNRKISTSLLFAIGSLAVLGATLTLYYRATQPLAYSDVSWVSAPISISAIIECTFGLVVVCMPSVAKIAQHHKAFVSATALLCGLRRLTMASGFSNSRSGRGPNGYDGTKESTRASSQKSLSKKHVTRSPTSDIESGEQVDGGHMMVTYAKSHVDSSYQRSDLDHGIWRTVEVHQHDETRVGTPQMPKGYF